MAIKVALEKVRTPLVFVQHHDQKFIQPFSLPNMVQLMQKEPEKYKCVKSGVACATLHLTAHLPVLFDVDVAVAFTVSIAVTFAVALLFVCFRCFLDSWASCLQIYRRVVRQHYWLRRAMHIKVPDTVTVPPTTGFAASPPAVLVLFVIFCRCVL
jgi:hypothetical protein